MNEHLEYLTELEQELDRVVGMLYQLRTEVTELKDLKYTPNTIVMLRVLKQRFDSIKLAEIIDRGIEIT